MKYTKIPETTFQNLQLNAGVLLSSFNPTSATVANESIIGATTGGINFTATPTYTDFGEDIDNCPKNMKELKKLDAWEISLSGTYVTVDANAVKSLVGAADVSGNKITPRNDLKLTDFTDVWWVGDYSDQNGETNGGFVAIHMMKRMWMVNEAYDEKNGSLMWTSSTFKVMLVKYQEKGSVDLGNAEDLVSSFSVSSCAGINKKRFTFLCGKTCYLPTNP